eukprot:TRINITY_DN1252_c0_g1_i5.p1 TRINITY_DN1252_c0_g1~~TRINITY_DN1252_c0_g1_i5.p1  ORF type:complete len:417 (+),score=68.94 TRINITY_DN1252_c0_g1_i5:720-1970(+)
MLEIYEVVFFTASTSGYADKVLDELDAGRKAYRLYRQHCTLLNCDFVKDLSQLGRDLKDVVMVDNVPNCYALQPCNGIPITTWIDDRNDKELDRFAFILELFAKVDDVRDYLREVVRENELDYAEAVRLLKGEITLDQVQKSPSDYWSSPRKKPAPSRERTQSQKKLMPHFEKASQEVNKHPISTKANEAQNKEKIREVKKSRTMSSCVMILTKEVLSDIKEKDKIRESAPQTPKKPYIGLLNRMNSSNAVSWHQGSTPVYCPSRTVLLARKPEKSLFAKAPEAAKDAPLNTLPPRPVHKRTVTSYTPKPIAQLSSEANKYLNYVMQEKTVPMHNRRQSTGTPTQANGYKPLEIVSYPKYINVQSSVSKYTIRNGHGSSTSVGMYSRLLGGSSTPSKMYEASNGSSSSAVWSTKFY